MAEQEDIAQLREDLTQQQSASITLLGIVKGIDAKVDGLTGSVRALQVNGTIVDARLNAMDARLSTVEARIGHVDATMASKQDVSRLEGMMGEILAGNAQQTEIMLRVLAKMGEQGE